MVRFGNLYIFCFVLSLNDGGGYRTHIYIYKIRTDPKFCPYFFVNAQTANLLNFTESIIQAGSQDSPVLFFRNGQTLILLNSIDSIINSGPKDSPVLVF